MYPNRNPKKDRILKQITEAQDAVENYMQRVEQLERKLKSKELSDDKRTKIEVELEDIKKSLLQRETDLKNFYGENSKTFFFSVMLMFFAFLFYGLYFMIYGHPKQHKTLFTD